MRRRRRLFRDDVLAPWLTLLVIIGLWWAGASLLGPSTSAVAPEGSGRRAVADRVAPLVPPPTARVAPVADAPETHAVLKAPPTDDDPAPAPATAGAAEITELQARRLAIPVQGVTAAQIVSNYDDDRGSGRQHEALDILSPRGTPVVAVEDGRIVKLFTSERGGLTIYQFDPTERYSYYYAHLDSYAADLKEGDAVSRGEVIGYVGTTGNAPPNTPHLHFGISRLGDEKKWWDGAPLDPAQVLR
jgi:murein DD-endopeptidase MepM/ murein hydrolase activator NlpD